MYSNNVCSAKRGDIINSPPLLLLPFLRRIMIQKGNRESVVWPALTAWQKEKNNASRFQKQIIYGNFPVLVVSLFEMTAAGWALNKLYGRLEHIRYIL